MEIYPFHSALPPGFVLLMNVSECVLALLYHEQSVLRNAAFPFFVGNLVADGASQP